MNWISVITSQDLGWPRGTQERLRDVVIPLRRDQTILKAFHLAAALGANKDRSYRDVDEQLLRGAPQLLRRRIQVLRQANPDTTFVFFEPWQQLLLAQQASRYSHNGDDAIALESQEGCERFFEACRIINDISMPPAGALVGDPIADALTAATNVIPRMWLMNPPNINNSIARMQIFLNEIPERHPRYQLAAATLKGRFTESLGVSFEDTVALTAFIGYWSMAPTYQAVMAGSRAVRIDPASWVAQTIIPCDVFERLLDRISQPLAALADPPTAAMGSPWFDPLPFRDRPLVRFSDGSAMVSMPEFLMEKAGFEMFWWLTEGPGGAQQQRAWQQAFGGLCERYVLDVLREMISDGAGYCENLQWANGELDALMWGGDHLAVVEVSSGFLPNAPKMSGDAQRVRGALKNRYVEHRGAGGEIEREAVVQLARDIEWLAAQRRANALPDIPLRQIEIIHPVLVAADRTVRTQGVWKYLDSELRGRIPDALPWQVAPLAVLGLEDLEWIEQAARDQHQRLQGVLPAFLQVLVWWQFDVDRNKAFWQLLADWLGEGRPNYRLRAASDVWLQRTRRLFRVNERGE